MKRINLFDLREVDKPRIYAGFEGFVYETQPKIFKNKAIGFHRKFLTLARMITSEEWFARLLDVKGSVYNHWYDAHPRPVSIANIEEMSKHILKRIDWWKARFSGFRERFLESIEQNPGAVRYKYKVTDPKVFKDLLYIVSFMANLLQKETRWNAINQILRLDYQETRDLRKTMSFDEELYAIFLEIIGMFEEELEKTRKEDFTNEGLTSQLIVLVTKRSVLFEAKLPTIEELAIVLGDIFSTGGTIYYYKEGPGISLQRNKKRRILIAKDLGRVFGHVYNPASKKYLLTKEEESAKENDRIYIPMTITSFILYFILNTENLNNDISLKELNKKFVPRVPKAVEKEERAWKPFMSSFISQAGGLYIRTGARRYKEYIITTSRGDLDSISKLFQKFGIYPIKRGNSLFITGKYFSKLEKLGGFRVEELEAKFEEGLSIPSVRHAGEFYIEVLGILFEAKNRTRSGRFIRISRPERRVEVISKYVQEKIRGKGEAKNALKHLYEADLVERSVEKKPVWWSISLSGELVYRKMRSMYKKNPREACEYAMTYVRKKRNGVA